MSHLILVSVDDKVYHKTAVPGDIVHNHFILPVLSLVIVVGNGLWKDLYVLITKLPILARHSLMNNLVVILMLSDFCIGCHTIPMMLREEHVC